MPFQTGRDIFEFSVAPERRLGLLAKKLGMPHFAVVKGSPGVSVNISHEDVDFEIFAKSTSRAHEFPFALFHRDAISGANIPVRMKLLDGRLVTLEAAEVDFTRILVLCSWHSVIGLQMQDVYTVEYLRSVALLVPPSTPAAIR